MKQCFVAVPLLLAALALATAARAEGFDYSAWERLLQQHVNDAGQVDYSAVKANAGDLERTVATIAACSPVSNPRDFPTRESQLAYWINAYNALVVEGVVENWPVKSVREIGALPFSFFWHKKFTVGGRKMTLDEIEGILRKQLHEPRVHFAIVCASISCPHLQRTAYLPGKVDRQLDDAARRFSNDPSKLTIDRARNRVKLSRIFQWYRGDFVAAARAKDLSGASDPVLSYILQYASPENREALQALHAPELEYFDYDWGINALRPPP